MVEINGEVGESKMTDIRIRPIELEEIKPRGKYRKDVVQCIRNFIELVEQKGIKAVETDPLPSEEAHSYYDSFRDYVKKKKLNIDVKIRKHNDIESKIVLVHLAS